MTDYRFFCGKGKSEVSAVREALVQCTDIMLNFPSIVVELVEMNPNASGYDAHIRVMAISDNIETKQHKKTPKPQAALETKPTDDLGRREGVEHEAGIDRNRTSLITKQSFDLAVASGLVPDIKTQDLNQFEGLGLSVEQVRAYLNNKATNMQRHLRIDGE